MEEKGLEVGGPAFTLDSLYFYSFYEERSLKIYLRADFEIWKFVEIQSSWILSISTTALKKDISEYSFW